MTGWWEGRMLGFDLETTGVDPETDRIVTAACAWVGGPDLPDITTWLVDPGVDIPEAATEVHGVTTERARSEGVTPAEALTDITDHLMAAAAEQVPVVVMNAPYDLTLLEREARRHRVAALFGLYPGLRVIDPKVLDKVIDQYRRGGRTLVDLCRTYDVRHDGTHDVGNDAVAACRVAWALGARTTLGRAPLDDLHVLQVRAAREQAISLAGYFRRTPGKESWADGVRTEWPLLPWADPA